MTSLRPVMFRSLLAISVCIITGCGGGGGGGGETQARVQGTAFTPPNVDPGKIAEENAPVQVLDFSQPADQRVVATSATDDKGHFDVTVPASPLIAVIVQGKAQVSGLVLADGNKILEINKDFDGATDIACRAGVQALTNNILSVDDFNNGRIANLENAARDLVKNGAVDFTSQSSVSAAVQSVSEMTNYGEHPAS